MSTKNVDEKWAGPSVSECEIDAELPNEKEDFNMTDTFSSLIDYWKVVAE
jgi:hypothetical protein